MPCVAIGHASSPISRQFLKGPQTDSCITSREPEALVVFEVDPEGPRAVPFPSPPRAIRRDNRREAMEPSAADNSLPRDEAEWRRRILMVQTACVSYFLDRTIGGLEGEGKGHARLDPSIVHSSDHQ
jgi:hypothetical protein